jgi:hypothetical protein
LEVLPNLENETVMVDSAPAIWGSSYGSEQTTIVLLVCYNVDVRIFSYFAFNLIFYQVLLCLIGD